VKYLRGSAGDPVEEIPLVDRRYEWSDCSQCERQHSSAVAGCLQRADDMRRRDSRPMTAQSGALPEIRLEGESVVFYLNIPTDSGPARLVLRCDPDGNVWSSIFAKGKPKSEK